MSKPEKKTLERHGPRSEDNIKNVSLNGVESIYLAEDKNKWKAPVKMLMDSQGPHTS